MKLTREDIEKYATELEKQFLKESLATIRSDAFIKSTNSDPDVWENRVRAMSKREQESAAFELQSAINGINYKFRKWMPPKKVIQKWHPLFGGEFQQHRADLEERRHLYRLYLNRVKKVMGK